MSSYYFGVAKGIRISAGTMGIEEVPEWFGGSSVSSLMDEV
jgi:hypothetical protein